ncbi:PAS domain-containing protein [Verrucomicrobiota bacterium sgz303538]
MDADSHKRWTFTDGGSVDIPLPSHTSARSVLNALRHVVWIANPDGFVTWMNAWGRDYLGTTMVESLGHQYMTRVHPDDHAVASAAWVHAQERAESLAVSYRIRVADGEYRWQCVHAQPVKDTDGHVKYWVGTCTDIHEQLARVERLRALLARRTGEELP